MSFAYKTEKTFTYSDYLSWNNDERWEIIDGRAYSMSPAPAPEHQKISMIISNEIYNHLKGKKCQVFSAPFDVMLFADAGTPENKINSLLQPDIFVVCDQSKIDSRALRGAPDLVVEILSPYTAERDFKDKFLLYEKARVPEYWIVDPANRSIHSFIIDPENRDSGRYLPGKIYFIDDILNSSSIEGLSMELKKIFG
jgi:Uma2 family endonuclease